MVLSNAERQERYRQRLRQAADTGVTPEMIQRVARIVYEQAAADDPSLSSWTDYLALTRKRGNRTNWSELMPQFDPADAEDVALVKESYGADAELVLKVSPVVRAVLHPPAQGLIAGSPSA